MDPIQNAVHGDRRSGRGWDTGIVMGLVRDRWHGRTRIDVQLESGGSLTCQIDDARLQNNPRLQQWLHPGAYVYYPGFGTARIGTRAEIGSDVEVTEYQNSAGGSVLMAEIARYAAARRAAEEAAAAERLERLHASYRAAVSWRRETTEAAPSDVTAHPPPRIGRRVRVV